MMKVLIGIQARSGSSRLPDKIYAQIDNKSVLEHVYDRCAEAKAYKNVLEIIPCVLGPLGDEKLEEFCQQKNLRFLPGKDKENDLIARFHRAMETFDADFLVRITSDCPLMDVNWINGVVSKLFEYDYVSNTMQRTCLDGHDVQGISRKAWEYYAPLAEEREHVFLDIEQDYRFRKRMQDDGFSVYSLIDNQKSIVNPYLQATKLSLDTEDDLKRIREVYAQLHRKG